jgi:hypothetical protein
MTSGSEGEAGSGNGTTSRAGLKSNRSLSEEPLRRPSARLVGLTGLVIGVGLALRVLIPHGMDPSIFVAFGEDSRVQTEYARELLGEVTTRRDLGHDGKFFFAQANDPWYLAPEHHAVVLDRPLYRAQRMLYPMVAGGFGLFPPWIVPWAMLLTNLLAMAVGATVAARIAASWGLSPWLGLWVPLNPGLIFELDIGGSGVLAYVCCLAAVHALERERLGLASVLFAAGALSRESMVAFAAGVFVLWWLDRKRAPWPILVAPLVALAGWTAYLTTRLDGIEGVGGGTRNFSAPFVGLFTAFGGWLEEPLSLLVSITLLAIVLVFVPLAVRSRTSIAWGALPFAALLIVLHVNVLREPANFSRVIAPIFTAFPFVILARDRIREPRSLESSKEIT